MKKLQNLSVKTCLGISKISYSHSVMRDTKWFILGVYWQYIHLVFSAISSQFMLLSFIRALGSKIVQLLQNNQQQNQEFYVDVFRPYYIHLVIRFLFGILFIVLHHTVLFSSGLDSSFKCSLPTTNGSQSVNATIQCEHSIASPQNLQSKIVSVLNI